ncbi:MAG: S1C family serine protease [Beijerinckiaceae bacterium]
MYREATLGLKRRDGLIAGLLLSSAAAAMVLTGGADALAQARGNGDRALQLLQQQHMQAAGSDIINANEVFVVIGIRKTQKDAIDLAQEYYRDFRSASAGILPDGRWVALAGWTQKASAEQLLQVLRYAGRLPYGAHTIDAKAIETVTWSATKSLARPALQIPANVRRTPLLNGMGIAGTWGASPGACNAGPDREDLLESPLRVSSRQMQWGSFGVCTLGSMVRFSGGVYVGATCGRGSDKETFVLSLRRRSAKLEVITDPHEPSKIYYQLDWCPRQGGQVARGNPGGSGPRVATAPSNPSVPPRIADPNQPPGRPKSTGSGFFVASTGHLVTNQHVVRGCNSVYVKGFGKAEVLQEDARNDLALLKLRTSKPVPFLKIRTMPVQLGQEVVVFGYPLSSILNNGLNVTTGIISSETGMRNDTRMLQFTAAIQPGNSGGPVVDRAGNLVAVVRSKFSDKFALDRGNFVPQNLNYGIKTAILLTFLSNNGVTGQKASPTKDRTVADLAAAAKSHTMLVTCH